MSLNMEPILINETVASVSTKNNEFLFEMLVFIETKSDKLLWT